MTKYNARSDKSERQESSETPARRSREVNKRLRAEAGDGQQWSNGFLDGGEMDDWLTAEDEIDHFVHNRQ